MLFLSLIFCKQEEKLLFFGSVSGCTCLILRCKLYTVKSAQVIPFRPLIFKWRNIVLSSAHQYSNDSNNSIMRVTGTCFIQKIYVPSSSLLLGKHLPFSPSPLRLNIFHLFVILSLTQLYRYTPEIFLFSTATFKYIYRAPSDELDKNSHRTWLSENLNHWNGYNHFRSGLNWFRKFLKICFNN